MTKLEIVGLIAVLLVILGTPAAAAGYESVLRSHSPNEITLVAASQENGGWSPAMIRVRQGERVTLRLTSVDVVHGLSLPAFSVDVSEIYPGRFTKVSFVADKAGHFPFTCLVTCGAQHTLMQGELVVEGLPGVKASPDSPSAARELMDGRQIFQENCGSCHGMFAEGYAGPALAGHSKAQMLAKVRGSKGPMPAFSVTQLGDADLEAIAIFVEGLGKQNDGRPSGVSSAGAPTVAQAIAEELARGKHVFQANCAGCHGRKADGAFDPPLTAVSRAQVRAKVREGKGSMPAFTPQQISDADLGRLATFVERPFK